MLIFLIPATRVGWNAWRRAAIQRALVMNVEKLWIDSRGLVTANVSCSFDRSRLALIDRLICPSFLKTEACAGGFEVHHDNALVAPQWDTLVTIDGAVLEFRTITDGVQYRIKFHSHLRSIESNASSSNSLGFPISARLTCFLPSDEVASATDRVRRVAEWKNKLNHVPNWITDPLIGIVIPEPETFIIQQFVRIDPNKLDFDFVHNVPIVAPPSVERESNP